MLNRVTLVAEVGEYGVQLRYRENGQPECQFSALVKELGRDGDTWFKTWVPIVVYGMAAERAASDLEPGMIVAIDGKLAWRAHQKKTGEGKAEGKIVVMATNIAVIQPDRPSESAPVERSDSGEGDDQALVLPMPSAPTPKARKPRYPKWHPDANQN